MTIERLEAIPLRARFKQTLRFGTTDRSESGNVIVKLTDQDGRVGYGEACPIAAFSRETPESVVSHLEQWVRPIVIGANALDRQPLLARLAPGLTANPFATAAVDTALLDLAGKTLGVSASRLLGGRFRDELEVHGSVGWQSNAAAMAEQAREQARMYRTLKLYIGRDELDADLRRLEAVRAAVPDAPFMVDVNGQWRTADCLRVLPTLQELGVTVLEQPVAASDRLGQAEIVRAGRVAVAADESLFGPADAAWIVSQRAAGILNLGVSKLGGVTRAAACAEVAMAGGLGLMVGSVLELGVGNAAGLQFAASIESLAAPSYLIGPLKYGTQITAPALEVRHSHVRVPDGPGLGIDVDEDALRSLDQRRTTTQ